MNNRVNQPIGWQKVLYELAEKGLTGSKIRNIIYKIIFRHKVYTD
jgi:hypothetical protein